MTLYQFNPQARDDLSSIWHYIAENSELAANRVASEIKKACDFVGGHPHAGHSRSDLTSKPVFFWNVYRLPYLIVYDPGTHPVEIMRILHGARNIADTL